jgi:hypothetical protein
MSGMQIMLVPDIDQQQQKVRFAVRNYWSSNVNP